MTRQLIIWTIFFGLTIGTVSASFAQTNNKLSCDSATIVFKNVTADTLKFIHAVIKGEEVGFYNLLAGQESSKFKVCVKGQNFFRFSVFKDNLQDKDSIEPMDYFEQVSEENIVKGTYVYYIGYKDGLLNIRLIKVE